ncbi:uncharacterized protein IUM83_11254 [Phytophthora cinnamomi]|uniref:uncharacterized protein n=1 Tax=Phytophthora cinnamomi TaxID=4785 RepID=UPI00355A2219|nr:hypothetical protein IUM83_11254 [Phytophthora cinnamomi]
MPARRETRADGVAFRVKLAGRAPAERQRLMTEHAAYLDGRREEDADFGEDKEGAGTSEAGTRPDEAATGPGTAAWATAPAARGQACGVPRVEAKGGPRRGEDEAEDPKKAEAKKANAEKKAAAAKVRVTRKEKNARAVARAEEAISRSAAAKEQRRLAVQAEVQRGEAAREAALILLRASKQNSPPARTRSSNTREAASSSRGKRKAKSNAAQKKKRQRRAGDVSEEDEDADDEDGGSYESRNASRSLSFEEIECAAAETPPAASSMVIPVTGDAEFEPTPDNNEPPPNDNELNSDLDGEGAGSEDWYTEEVPVPDRRTEAELDAEAEEVALGQDLLAGRRLRARQAMDRERMRAARAKLTRDWDTITDTWDGFTPEELAVLAQDPDALKKMRKTGWNFDPDTQPQRTEAYPGLYAGEYGPTDEVLEKAESPLELFFFFMPPRMWRRIAAESNKYYNQHVNDRVDRMFEKQVARDDTTTREAVMLAEAKKHKRIQPEEILHIIGLLIARTLCPHKRRFADHWQRSSVGAVPKGTFGRYMSKARFGRVMQNLHFTDNTDPKAATDRAWKVRSVVDQLQSTFAAGYKVPPVLAFDESMIPSQSRFNITRQFMKDKPHKWGTKLFMTCCADTAYCFRLEVFCGTEQQADELGGDDPTKYSADPNSGPTAVIRNLDAVLPPRQDGVYHVVVTDRFYTSIQLALQLLNRNVYLIGRTKRAPRPPSSPTRSSALPTLRGEQL